MLYLCHRNVFSLAASTILSDLSKRESFQEETQPSDEESSAIEGEVPEDACFEITL
jgi:hypothetical protein